MMLTDGASLLDGSEILTLHWRDHVNKQIQGHILPICIYSNVTCQNMVYSNLYDLRKECRISATHRDIKTVCPRFDLFLDLPQARESLSFRIKNRDNGIKRHVQTGPKHHRCAPSPRPTSSPHLHPQDTCAAKPHGPSRTSAWRPFRSPISPSNIARRFLQERQHPLYPWEGG